MPVITVKIGGASAFKGGATAISRGATAFIDGAMAFRALLKASQLLITLRNTPFVILKNEGFRCFTAFSKTKGRWNRLFSYI